VGTLKRASDDLEKPFGAGAEIVVEELVLPRQVEQTNPQSFVETLKPLLLIGPKCRRHFVLSSCFELERLACSVAVVGLGEGCFSLHCIGLVR